jgi:hypothetical protein
MAVFEIGAADPLAVWSTYGSGGHLPVHQRSVPSGRFDYFATTRRFGRHRERRRCPVVCSGASRQGVLGVGKPIDSIAGDRSQLTLAMGHHRIAEPATWTYLYTNFDVFSRNITGRKVSGCARVPNWPKRALRSESQETMRSLAQLGLPADRGTIELSRQPFSLASLAHENHSRPQVVDSTVLER